MLETVDIQEPSWYLLLKPYLNSRSAYCRGPKSNTKGSKTKISNSHFCYERKQRSASEDPGRGTNPGVFTGRSRWDGGLLIPSTNWFLHVTCDELLHALQREVRRHLGESLRTKYTIKLRNIRYLVIIPIGYIQNEPF